MQEGRQVRRICGQGPSDHPDLAEWLLEQGIESMSLNPDTVVDTWLALAKVSEGQSGIAANARTGKVASPATFTGTALKVAPVAGSGRGR